MIIPKWALGWLLIILGVVIGGFCAYGELSGRIVEMRTEGRYLMLGSAGMIVLGILYNRFVLGRKR